MLVVGSDWGELVNCKGLSVKGEWGSSVRIGRVWCEFAGGRELVCVGGNNYFWSE